MEPARLTSADSEAARPTCRSAMCSTSTPRIPSKADGGITVKEGAVLRRDRPARHDLGQQRSAPRPPSASSRTMVLTPRPASTLCSGRSRRRAEPPDRRKRGRRSSLIGGKIAENRSQTHGFDAQNEQYAAMRAPASSTRSR